MDKLDDDLYQAEKVDIKNLPKIRKEINKARKRIFSQRPSLPDATQNS